MILSLNMVTIFLMYVICIKISKISAKHMCETYELEIYSQIHCIPYFNTEVFVYFIMYLNFLPEVR